MFNVEFFCPLWGSENIPFETFLQKVKAKDMLE